MKILVTGAYGMLGTSLQKIIKQKSEIHNNGGSDGGCSGHHEYKYVSSNEYDLRNEIDTHSLFNQFRPDVVIHLASCVGGVYKNLGNNYSFLMDNTKMHLNIINCCNVYNVKRLINILSTCIFPDEKVEYPLTSDQLHNGLPHYSNIGYAFSKRILHLASKLLSNKDSNFKVINITPTNLYGENDNYNLFASHVIPGLVHKVYIAQKYKTPLEVLGTGKAIRQFLYADDLSQVIYKFIDLELEENETSLIVSPPEKDEISITDLVYNICNIFGFDHNNIIYNEAYSDGQYKKTTNDSELKKYLPDFQFTPLNVGLENVISYFNEYYNFVRK